MRTVIRTSARLLGVAALAVLLSGCLKATQELTINENDTVDGVIVFAVNKGFLDLAGISADDFLEQVTQGEGPVPGGVDYETQPYEDDDFIGSTFTFEGAPLSAFSDASGGDVSIAREGDTYVVSGTLDASTEDLDPSGTPGAQQLLDSFDVRISITFPGEVESATGEIDGNTVTWTPELGETTEISARGSAIASGGGGMGALPWIILGAIAVLAAVVLLVVLGRRKTPPAEVTEAVDPGGLPPTPPEVAAVGGTTPVALTPPPPAPVTEPEPPAERVTEPEPPADTASDPDAGGADEGGGSD